jgi:serine/threonine protein kinase
MSKIVYINPTKTTHKDYLISLYKQHDGVNYFDDYKNYKVKHNGKNVKLHLDRPILHFQKPTETEKSPQEEQQQQHYDYYAVINPERVGKGSFGGVYLVDGTWKVTENGAEYKTKPAEKKRMVKKGMLNTHEIEKYRAKAQREYWISHHTPQMGVDFPIVEADNHWFMLMRKQPGISLKKLIKKLKQNPNHISVMKRLELSLALLEVLKSQAHDVKIPIDGSNDFTNILHLDIKPANIMVDLDAHPLRVNLIDYGLSDTLTNKYLKTGHVIGTPLYIDPIKIKKHHHDTYNEKKIQREKTDDLFGMAMTIAELWGDTSRDSLKNMNQLITQNYDIPLSLFKGIENFNDEQKKAIEVILVTMTRFAVKDRLSHEQSLKQFKQALANRIEYLTTSPQCMADIIDTLNSPWCDSYIEKLITSDAQLEPILSPLSKRLSDLNLDVIVKLEESILPMVSKELASNFKIKSQIERLRRQATNKTLGEKLDKLSKEDIAENLLKEQLVAAKGIINLYEQFDQSSFIESIDELFNDVLKNNDSLVDANTTIVIKLKKIITGKLADLLTGYTDNTSSMAQKLRCFSLWNISSKRLETIARLKEQLAKLVETPDAEKPVDEIIVSLLDDAEQETTKDHEHGVFGYLGLTESKLAKQLHTLSTSIRTTL